MPELVKGRELVAELSRRGIGDWEASVVRRWIEEEPACPIAQRGRPGQSHRYDVDAVVDWLADRDQRAGLNGSGAPADAAGERLAQQAVAVARQYPSQADELSELDVLTQAAEQAAYSETVSLMLRVLQGRDPRTWKAAEDALMTRLKRQELERQLIPADEIAPAWQRVVVGLRSALLALPHRIDQLLDAVEPGQGREDLIRREIENTLKQVREHVIPGR
ncbi:MAG: hypothetical protein PF501_07555 [Salinisphaera sp.]|jgi:phage terminase Nu1 subunit (DNA packaging protein)|nr:hypothetical protein [Salinisphaera sp.]